MFYEISKARLTDLPAIGSIERAGGRMLATFLGVEPLEEITPHADLEAACSQGRLWVARAGEWPVGFALAQPMDGAVHLEEVDVLPEHGRRGIGTALVGAVSRWAREQPCPYVTLTTFRAVPWNMPFYLGLGFEALPGVEWTPALARRVEEETARGLDPGQRVVMRARADRAAVAVAARLARSPAPRARWPMPRPELFDRPGD